MTSNVNETYRNGKRIKIRIFMSLLVVRSRCICNKSKRRWRNDSRILRWHYVRFRGVCRWIRAIKVKISSRLGKLFALNLILLFIILDHDLNHLRYLVKCCNVIEKALRKLLVFLFKRLDNIWRSERQRYGVVNYRLFVQPLDIHLSIHQKM